MTVLVAGEPEETLSVAGEKLQVAAVGRLAQARVTVPPKLFVGTALTTAVTDEPAETVRADAEALKP